MDLRDIAMYMSYLEVPVGETLVEVGERAENFHIILDGTVTVLIRNEIIDQWDWAMELYKLI